MSMGSPKGLQIIAGAGNVLASMHDKDMHYTIGVDMMPSTAGFGVTAAGTKACQAFGNAQRASQ